jgi:hypothetical protein
MRSANGVPPRVALTPAALIFLHVSIGDGRGAPAAPSEPRTSPAPDSESRENIHQHISLKPSGFPFLRVTL